MVEDMKVLGKNGTWELVSLLMGKKTCEMQIGFHYQENSRWDY